MGGFSLLVYLFHKHFGSEPDELSPTFWVSFNKLLNIVCWNRGPFLLTEPTELYGSYILVAMISLPGLCLEKSLQYI